MLLKKPGTDPYMRKIKVVDFGISGYFKNTTENTDYGTLLYMPPEMITERNVNADPTIDIWAMGVVLYAMLFDTFPFEAESTSDTKKKISEGKFTLPEETD